jgi:hypothetical protein
MAGNIVVNIPQKKVKVPEVSNNIYCASCGAHLYTLMGEIVTGRIIWPSGLKPINETIPQLALGDKPICPLCEKPFVRGEPLECKLVVDENGTLKP